jgi:hypothetical protein
MGASSVRWRGLLLQGLTGFEISGAEDMTILSLPFLVEPGLRAEIYYDYFPVYTSLPEIVIAYVQLRQDELASSTRPDPKKVYLAKGTKAERNGSNFLRSENACD